MVDTTLLTLRDRHLPGNPESLSPNPTLLGQITMHKSIFHQTLWGRPLFFIRSRHSNHQGRADQMLIFYKLSWTILHHWSDTRNMMGEPTMSWRLLSAGHGYNFLCLSEWSCWKVMRQKGGVVGLADGLLLIRNRWLEKDMESTGDMEFQKASAEKLPTANIIGWCEWGQRSQSDWRIIWRTLAVSLRWNMISRTQTPQNTSRQRDRTCQRFHLRSFFSMAKFEERHPFWKNHNLSKLSRLDGSKIS